MIGVPLVLSCPPEAVKKLSDEQGDIDKLVNFAEKVALAETRWANRTGNQAFDAVRDRLAELRPGKQYCCYCEHNTTSAIEHIWPKSLYPEHAFVWWNYLLVCFRCNTEKKGKQWAMFGAGDTVSPVTSATAFPISDAVFLDLRMENPLALIRLDFSDWQLKPRNDIVLSVREKRRVEYTVETVLELNDEAFRSARRALFQTYYQDLKTYRRTRDAELARANILGNLHPTVWFEMKRQSNHPKLKRLFDGISEVLDW
ncbi:hypothetical protein [Armatimonas sp.]|uniref:hypothetical protein n=1 Tax=Armatimonas sp. TaxID=1872638 RepID=UPI0037501F1B